MPDLIAIGQQVAFTRKALRLSQAGLAKKAGLSRSTIDALENGRLGELGYAKVNNILAALGLELTLREVSAARPTLEDLMREEQG
ncbi:MAG TPA: helix-turn-helix domain-containing protein [Acidobacteriaceae bacterium]|jgi:transcriptional regulator with XRE-family HTH domain|nr:helix-turn-helix domain-containing protein [Acidobacteriaceae bacterium]